MSLASIGNCLMLHIKKSEGVWIWVWTPLWTFMEFPGIVLWMYWVCFHVSYLCIEFQDSQRIFTLKFPFLYVGNFHISLIFKSSPRVSPRTLVSPSPTGSELWSTYAHVCAPSAYVCRHKIVHPKRCPLIQHFVLGIKQKLFLL